MKSAEIQEQINSLDLAIQQGATDAQLNLWEMKRKELQDQLQVALAEETQQQERIDAQAEKIETITLAYDYNEILGNPMANETIIENVKQFQLQAYEEHNAEVARLSEEWRKKFQEEIAIELDQKARIIELQNELQSAQDGFDELTGMMSQIKIEKADAEVTRDNAVRISEEVKNAAELLSKENAELKEQIEALKQELTAKKALTVSGNEKLAELAAKAKESTAAAAQRGIERWNTQYGTEIPVLPVPEIQPVNDVTEKVAPAQEIPFPEIEVHASIVGLADQSLPLSGEESEVITLESLQAQVNAIKAHVGLAA